jgi:methylenetetrahydrofolate dehydrogenase (NADP+)/methenyltetrahydrofolate cyclohydrolase
MDEVLAVIAELNADPAIHGVICQLPVPDHLDAFTIQCAIDPRKDVDGLHPENLGRLAMGRPRFVPATPFGVVELLKRSGTPLDGARAVVVGRSNLVGRPVSILLGQRECNATVTLCHTGTKDLAEHTRSADVVVTAAGTRNILTGDMLKPGATVIDVGTNPGPDGGLVGDCEFASCVEVAGRITPVPGGVGPMTVAMLLDNTARAAGA